MALLSQNQVGVMESGQAGAKKSLINDANSESTQFWVKVD